MADFNKGAKRYLPDIWIPGVHTKDVNGSRPWFARDLRAKWESENSSPVASQIGAASGYEKRLGALVRTAINLDKQRIKTARNFLIKEALSEEGLSEMNKDDLRGIFLRQTPAEIVSELYGFEFGLNINKALLLKKRMKVDETETGENEAEIILSLDGAVVKKFNWDKGQKDLRGNIDFLKSGLNTIIKKGLEINNPEKGGKKGVYSAEAAGVFADIFFSNIEEAMVKTIGIGARKGQIDVMSLNDLKNKKITIPPVDIKIQNFKGGDEFSPATKSMSGAGLFSSSSADGIQEVIGENALKSLRKYLMTALLGAIMTSEVNTFKDSTLEETRKEDVEALHEQTSSYFYYATGQNWGDSKYKNLKDNMATALLINQLVTWNVDKYAEDSLMVLPVYAINPGLLAQKSRNGQFKEAASNILFSSDILASLYEVLYGEVIPGMNYKNSSSFKGKFQSTVRKGKETGVTIMPSLPASALKQGFGRTRAGLPTMDRGSANEATETGLINTLFGAKFTLKYMKMK